MLISKTNNMELLSTFIFIFFYLREPVIGRDWPVKFLAFIEMKGTKAAHRSDSISPLVLVCVQNRQFSFSQPKIED